MGRNGMRSWDKYQVGAPEATNPNGAPHGMHNIISAHTKSCRMEFEFNGDHEYANAHVDASRTDFLNQYPAWHTKLDANAPTFTGESRGIGELLQWSRRLMPAFAGRVPCAKL